MSRACFQRKSGSALAAIVLLVGVLFAGSVTAEELYRYINEDGVTVLDNHVPARYVDNGYTVLSLTGQVLEVVPRALSESEIQERNDKAVEQQHREKTEREQKIADQNLLRIYSTPDDVIRARDAKIASIEGFIEDSRSSLGRMNSQKRLIESQYADIERSGGNITDKQINQIRALENRISQNRSGIELKLSEIDVVRGSFATALKRVQELYGLPASDL
ncbi:MAG: hypothetical protein ABGY96_16520 [bacterium]|nr:hypothetical protein [Gammaproteobacteria bacterium]HIL98452.1 hypothetical protein [Pseudomonadales bacterium]